MRRIALLLAIVTVVTLSDVAQATSVPPVPADTVPQTAPYLAIARAAWPNSSCAGREIIGFSDMIGSANGIDPDAGAVPELCYVVLNPRLLDPANAYNLCAVLTHEFGHLAGQEHSADPTSIMAPRVPATYAPCLSALGIVVPPAPVIVAPITQPAAPTVAKKPVARCKQKTHKAQIACQRKRRSA